MDTTSEAIWLLTLTSFLTWGSLYGILCLVQPRRSYEWNYRVVILIHATAVLSLTAPGTFNNPWPLTHPGSESTIFEIRTMEICLGYFLFDLGWCLWFYHEKRKVMIIHHVVSIVIFAASLTTGLSGMELGTVIFLTELSNPMLQFRWFMPRLSIKNSALYGLNEFLFLLTFVVGRFGFLTHCMYHYLLHPRPLLIFKLGGLALHLVSMVFMVEILQVAHRKYTGMSVEGKSRDQTVEAAKAK